MKTLLLFLVVLGSLFPVGLMAEQKLTVTCPSGQEALIWTVPWKDNGVWYFVKCEGITASVTDDNVVPTAQQTTDK